MALKIILKYLKLNHHLNILIRKIDENFKLVKYKRHSELLNQRKN